ncbi:universal stress protein [Colwellia sp. MSW7]|uniref:Universal stress protein n=1 Tax=Colwellia maritima TaxID=2912588 RepID=A0ABS9X157_9GAMM|nr:universal stress protein [Colwellia maritima]MCI2283921.1 universal stress protein [Colwellia maritima]
MNKIITCIDGSSITQSVADAGIWAAKKLNETLCFLHTIEKEQQHGADDFTGTIGLGARSSLLKEMTKLDEQKSKIALQLGSELLEFVASSAKTSGIEHIETLQRHGDVVEALLDLEKDTRLIVIGRSGLQHNSDFKALGSHIETLLRKSAQPVFIVPKTFSAPKSFMIAYDGRASAERALQKVLDSGLLNGVDCHLVSVKNNEPALMSKFESAKIKLQTKGFTVTTAFLEGNINEALMTYQKSHDIELVIMGAFGHSKIRQFFVGSNTMKMLEKTPVPLIVLR